MDWTDKRIKKILTDYSVKTEVITNDLKDVEAALAPTQRLHKKELNRLVDTIWAEVNGLIDDLHNYQQTKLSDIPDARATKNK
jgi:hypothetical protein